MKRKIDVMPLITTWGERLDITDVFYVLRESLYYKEPKYAFEVQSSKIRTNDGKVHLVFTTNMDDRDALMQQANQLKRIYQAVHELPGITYLRYSYLIENKSELFINKPERMSLNHFEDKYLKDNTKISELTAASIIQINYRKCIMTDLDLLNRLLHWIYVPMEVQYSNPYEKEK